MSDDIFPSREDVELAIDCFGHITNPLPSELIMLKTARAYLLLQAANKANKSSIEHMEKQIQELNQLKAAVDAHNVRLSNEVDNLKRHGGIQCS